MTETDPDTKNHKSYTQKNHVCNKGEAGKAMVRLTRKVNVTKCDELLQMTTYKYSEPKESNSTKIHYIKVFFSIIAIFHGHKFLRVSGLA